MPKLLFASLALAASSVAYSQEVVTYYIKQQGASKLLEEAQLIADPTSDRYGDFLSFEQVVELQRPAPEHVAQVHAYLDSLGVQDRRATLAGDKIIATMPSGVRGPAANAVPDELAGVIDGAMSSASPIMRTTSPVVRNRTQSKMSAGGSLPSCFSDYSINAKCLRTLYNVDALPASSHPDNLQTVIVNEEFLPSDLKDYLQAQGLPDQKVEKLLNGKLTGQPQTEASLDIEFIISFGSGTRTWWFYIDGHATNPFAPWLTYMSNSSTIPLVHSLSVGCPENEVGNALVARMNTEMAALGARGATIVFASGDSSYQPTQKFGAGSPHVTSVGGVWNGELGGDKFLSVDDISTGGFSSLDANAAPDYQKKAVAHYLTTSGTRPSNLDASKRCVPDLSLFDNGVGIRVNGQDTPTGGTSASAPQLAGMLSLINDALLHKKHSPLGFVNPLLYANADAFQDITKGGNNGFDAVEGYDPASGLGTFDTKTLTKLRDAAIAAKAAAAKKRAAGTTHNVIV